MQTKSIINQNTISSCTKVEEFIKIHIQMKIGKRIFKKPGTQTQLDINLYKTTGQKDKLERHRHGQFH